MGISRAAITQCPQTPGEQPRPSDWEREPPTWIASSMKTAAWSKQRSRQGAAPAGREATLGDNVDHGMLTCYGTTETEERTCRHSFPRLCSETPFAQHQVHTGAAPGLAQHTECAP